MDITISAFNLSNYLNANFTIRSQLSEPVMPRPCFNVYISNRENEPMLSSLPREQHHCLIKQFGGDQYCIKTVGRKQ